VQSIPTLDSLRTATHDPLLLWTAQGMRPDARAWTAGHATAVATPDVARRDRLAVNGPVTDALPLIKKVLAEVGPHFRLLGDAALIAGLCAQLPGLTLRGTLGWMHTAPSPPKPIRAACRQHPTTNH